ncbi:hypothetical protein EVAR_49947_1 [Eumeta japonica]|uniref:Uncharacterized protein n=1 Tax=Eumeta variegata TaxID=151549 RepID=A0A4C1XVE0_EUMVA|nr:hypothetical protein EVAR_49947_1 [Eumeta japonica]
MFATLNKITYTPVRIYSGQDAFCFHTKWGLPAGRGLASSSTRFSARLYFRKLLLAGPEPGKCPTGAYITIGYWTFDAKEVTNGRWSRNRNRT